MENEDDYIDYKVKYPKLARLILIILALWSLGALAFFLLCPNSAHAGAKAEIKIKSVLKVSNKKHDNVLFFGEIPNAYAIPEGYEPAAIGEFKTGVVTVKCDFDVLMELCKDKCKELNCEGYALTDLKQPSILNTCFQSKVIFLIALKR